MLKKKMAAIRYMAAEAALDMAEELRGAAVWLERTADEVNLGADLKEGLSATDTLFAVRAIKEKLSDACDAVHQLHRTIFKPEPRTPPCAQEPDVASAEEGDERIAAADAGHSDAELWALSEPDLVLEAQLAASIDAKVARARAAGMYTSAPRDDAPEKDMDLCTGDDDE